MEKPDSKDKKLYWAIGLILLLCFLSHGPILSADFVWDDFSLIKDNPTMRDVRYLPLFFTTDLGKFNLVPREMGFYRPLQSTTFLIDWYMFGGRPWGFHLINLLLHCIASVAVFGIARRLRLSFWPAFGAGALFAVMPGKSEEVFFIANRGGVMAAALALVSFWAYLVFIDEKKKKWYGLSLLAMAAGLLSKETPIVLPAVIVLTTIFFHQENWQKGSIWDRIRLAGGGQFLVAFCYLGWRFGLLQIYGTSQRPEGGILLAISNMGPVLVKYLRILAFPVGLTPDHGFEFARPLPTALVICSWIGLLLIAGFSFLLIRKAPIVPYGLLLFGLLISPLLNLVPIDRPFSEHYLYLPAAGFCLGAAGLFELGYKRSFQKIATGLGIVVLLIFTGVTAKTATWWHDSCSLWQRANEVQPTAWTLNNLGTCFTKRGDMEKASAFFHQAQQLDPGNYKAAYNLGLEAIRVRNFDGAKQQLELALKLKPDYLRAILAFGVLGYSKGHTTEELISEAKKLSPIWVESLLGYAHAAGKEGKNKQAQQAVTLYQELGGKGIQP